VAFLSSSLWYRKKKDVYEGRLKPKETFVEKDFKVSKCGQEEASKMKAKGSERGKNTRKGWKEIIHTHSNSQSESSENKQRLRETFKETT